MHRRDFLAASVAAAVGMMGANSSDPVLAAGETPGPATDQLMLELRQYRFSSAAKQQRFEQFLADDAVPAYNRASIEPVGVFKLLTAENPELKLKEESTDLWLLLPHKSFESVITLEQRLGADEAFQKAGQEVLLARKADPAFTRYDTALLYAMEGFQKVAPPEKAEGRVLELRTYESPNPERALNKLKMFNSGEFSIFDRAGMPGVFFGEAVAGANLPQLTYMVAHSQLEDVKKNWNAFGHDPDWKALNGNPSYKDNVSKILRFFLRPAAGSQI